MLVDSSTYFSVKGGYGCIKVDFLVKWGFGTYDHYLGDNVENIQLEDGHIVWYANCVDYIKSSIDKCW